MRNIPVRLLLLFLAARCPPLGAWVSKQVDSKLQRQCHNRKLLTLSMSVPKESWSVSDDWNLLSSENSQNSNLESSDIFNQDLALNAAQAFEAAGTNPLTEEDKWINTVVDEIHNMFATLDDVSLYDSDFEEPGKIQGSMEDMSNEIAMLVRCNKNPEDLLFSEGRALPPLTERERNDINQLVDITEDSVEATSFLKSAVHRMMLRHALPDQIDGKLSLDRKGVARWMTECLKTEEGLVSAHDSRVLKTISDYGSYGSGRLLEEDLQKLYLFAIVGEISARPKDLSLKRHLELRQSGMNAVWRDIRNHGITSPVEDERKKLAEEMSSKIGLSIEGRVHSGHSIGMLVDECEILDWDYSERSSDADDSPRMTASGHMSSHKLVDMTPKTETPLWMRDGDFIFIDEESCIGCMQCVNAAPNSFLMLSSGRARTFRQRSSVEVKQAVAACPVDCMHPVTYKELKKYETARDEGDGRKDHKHLGHQRGHTPLYVAGIDSDNNHRSSWYHTLKSKCLMSSQCPQNGCYDCPAYSGYGMNPYFQKHQKQEDHTRAQYFTENGDIDVWRKNADL